MDKRHTQITEGAGQIEARLNQDFIDLLKRFLLPAMIVILAIILVVLGLKRLAALRDTHYGQAFAQLEAAIASRSPSGLVRTADDLSGYETLALRARYEAARGFYTAAMPGLEPGAQFDPVTHTLKNEKDLLTPDRRKAMLEQARQQAQLVADASRGNNDLDLLFLASQFALGAIDETSGQNDQAKAAYDQVIARAKDRGFDGYAQLAAKWKDAVGTGKPLSSLPTFDEVQSYDKPIPLSQDPTPLMPEAPAALPASGTSANPPANPAAAPAPPPVSPPAAPAAPAPKPH